MADDADRASEVIAAREAAGVRQVLAGMADQGPGSGICNGCSEPIEPERLKANPRARLCGECACEAEQEAKRLRRAGPRG